MGHQLKAIDDSTAAGGARAQGAGRVHPASWGSQRGGGRAGGRLKPDVKVTIGGDRPPRLCGDVVTFEDMREFLVAFLEYEQQIRVANEDGGDRVLEKFAGVDVQQTSDVDFCRQIFRVLKMDASVPVDSRVFMQKRALRKYLADSGLTDVVKPGGRQYTLKHVKVLVEAISMLRCW